MTGRDAEESSDTGYGETSQYAAHLDRGWALLDRGDLDAARTSVSHAQEVRPDDPDALVLQGAIALAEGNAAESLRCYERALELDPEYLEPYLAAAQVCLYDLDEPRRALRICEDALELDGLAPFELLDLVLVAAEAELSVNDAAAGRTRLASNPHLGLLEAALDLAAGREDLQARLDDPDPVWAQAAQFLSLDHDGEPLEAEERIERVGRVQHYAARWARLVLDLGDTDEGLRLLGRMVELFPDDADAWYLCSEAEHRHGDARRGADAALRALELDTADPPPRFVPSAAIVHRRVVTLLQTCEAAEISALVEADVAFAVLIRPSPAAELVAEGIDPRVSALALIARSPEPEGGVSAATPPTVTGVAIYLRNIARFADDAEGFEQEVKYAVLDELAAALGLPDARREALGLATGQASPLSPPPDDPPESEKPTKSQRRRRRGSRALN